MSQIQVPVVIVGGGIVGLSATLFLQRQGVESLLVERRASPSEHPRSRGVNTRTHELYRELGLEQAVLDAGAKFLRLLIVVLLMLRGGLPTKRAKAVQLFGTFTIGKES